MATKLYFINAAASGSISGYDPLKLDPTIGSGVFNQLAVATTASGNHIEFPSGGSFSCFAMQVNAVTISGSISFNFWAFENAMTTNARAACRVARFDSGGAFVSDIVANANANHPDDVELGTSAAAMTWSATPTSTSLSAGDWLVCIPHADSIGTMAVGSVSLDFDVSSSGVDGDTFVTFTETITAYVAPTYVPYVTPMPPLLAQ